MKAQTAIITGKKAICGSDSTVLSVSKDFASYRWSTGATTKSITVFSVGIYTVTVTDDFINNKIDSIQLSQQPKPTPNIEGVPYVCSSRATTLSVPGPFQAFKWSTGETTPQIMPSKPDSISVTATDTFGCTGTASIVVRDGSKPFNSLPDTVKICAGDSVVLDASTPFATSYYWTLEDTLATLTVKDTGRYSVITTTVSCVNYDTVYVLILPPPIANLGVDTSICKGDTLILRAVTSLLYNIKWSDGSKNPTLKAGKEGIYGVEVTFGRCKATDSVTVSIFNKQAKETFANVICTPDHRIMPYWPGAKSYIWQNNKLDTAIVVNKTGTYNITATNGKCFVNLEYIDKFVKKPVLNLGSDTTLCLEFEQKGITLNANNTSEANFTWQDESKNKEFEVKQSGNYRVKAQNECGEAFDDINIVIKYCYSVFVPNVFSPNGDNINDFLRVYPTADVASIKSFNIYNRWGNMVFQSNAFTPEKADNNAWDGRMNNRLLEPDVYLYFIEIITNKGDILIQKGDFTLMR